LAAAVSGLPVMHNPEHQIRPEPEESSPQSSDPGQADSREEDEDFRQWVALVVLLACWLAEAYM